MLAVYAFVSLFTFPFYALFFFYMMLLRKFAFFLISIPYAKRLEPMVSSDVYWAIGEKCHNNSHILLMLNGKDRVEDVEKNVKNVVQKRVINNPEKFGKLLCSLNSFLGYPFLLRENITADDIVTAADVESLNYDSVEQLMADWCNKPMPRKDKLLWELIVVKAPVEWKQKNNLKDDQVPVIIRFNHCLADGLSCMNLCIEAFGENDVNLDKALKHIPKRPEWTKIPLLDFARNAFWFFIIPGYFVVEFFNKTTHRYNGAMSGNKQNFAYRAENTSENFLQVIKKLKRDIPDTAFSEIILTAISGSLQKHFQKLGGDIPVKVPIATVYIIELEPLNLNGIPQLRNQFSLITMDIPVKVTSKSVLSRLEVLKKVSRKNENVSNLAIYKFINSYLTELMPLPLIKVLLPTVGMWGSISNLPEFPKLILFNGYELDHLFFFTLHREQMASGFSIMSYNNQIHLGLSADTNSIATKEECKDIVNDTFATIELLQQEFEATKLEATKFEKTGST